MFQQSKKDNEKEYLESHKAFFDLYNPLRAQYGLAMNSHFSIHSDDNWIKIWRCEHGQKLELICNAEGETDAECYRNAAHHMEFWAKLKGENTAAKAG